MFNHINTKYGSVGTVCVESWTNSVKLSQNEDSTSTCTSISLVWDTLHLTLEFCFLPCCVWHYNGGSVSCNSPVTPLCFGRRASHLLSQVRETRAYVVLLASVCVLSLVCVLRAFFSLSRCQSLASRSEAAVEGEGWGVLSDSWVSSVWAVFCSSSSIWPTPLPPPNQPL